MKIEIDANVLIAGWKAMDNLMEQAFKNGDQLSSIVRDEATNFYGEMSVALINHGLAYHRSDGYVVLKEKL